VSVGAPEQVLDLVERFDRNVDAYRSGSYNETQARREFIDPLFKALGWDIDNESGYAEAYKDVIHEDAIKVGGVTKAPDYCFRVGGTRKFFVEAKKPAVNIKNDVEPAFQLRRYAWSAKLPLSILTDFEEFAVYDCRVKPDKADGAATARTIYLPYTRYDDEWDTIASTFGKEAVLQGSFDKYAETTKGKRGTAEVDAAFLREIEEWRDLLAHNLALRNQSLTQRELNYAVQVTIDRLIFLRICEDRGVEDYGGLQALLNGAGTYPRLLGLYTKADRRYNSGLFHFEREHGRNEGPDTLTPGLTIDDKALKDIIRRMYYPDSPYEFSVLPADILGQVYEQFLGKVIRLTAGHQARVEDKPEVKKAGGVYYTPTYIVDYIVKNTVGKLLESSTPRKASALRVLDPACGSGSFLIGAYQYLVDWHRDRYVDGGPEKHTKELFRGPGGEWRLTTAEKKRILLNNIYGVDIDSQAVETTKLSLLLKVLEGETAETINAQLSFLHERALPDLSDNIKCGNSLIGPAFYDDQQLGLTLFDDEERYRINAFDWEAEFAGVTHTGGFDCVVGNPPYIPIEMMSGPEKAYYQSSHHELGGKFDSSVVFILAGLARLKPSGRLGFISSVTWQTGENYSQLRETLFTQHGVELLVNLPFDVFKAAYVDTGIYVLSASNQSGYRIHRFPKKEKNPQMEAIDYVFVSSDLVRGPDFKIVLDPLSQSILGRVALDGGFVPLGEVTTSTQGLAGNRFVYSPERRGDSWLPFLKQGQVYRYLLQVDEIQFADMSEHPSLVRYYGASPKILIRRVINREDRLMATLTERELVFKKDVNPFVLTDSTVDAHFILGVVNSRLISHLYVNTSSIATKDDFRQTTLAELRRLPIPRHNPSNGVHVELAATVAEILRLRDCLTSARAPHEREAMERQSNALDRRVDGLVYQLYGLTDDEIAHVESSAGKK
jgi:hypothetical protein